jgi:hypothetical protein
MEHEQRNRVVFRALCALQKDVDDARQREPGAGAGAALVERRRGESLEGVKGGRGGAPITVGMYGRSRRSTASGTTLRVRAGLAISILLEGSLELAGAEEGSTTLGVRQ